MSIKQTPPHPLFLTDRIKIDGIPTKIKWKIHTCLFTLYIFEVLKQEHVQIFPRPLPSKTCASLWFHIRERLQKYLLLSAWHRELYKQGPQFSVIWQTWIYMHRIFRSVILVSILTLRVYLTFSLFFKIWLTESILISRE